MKHVFCIIYLITIALTCFAQAPAIEWQNTIGGNNLDEAYAIHPTADNGFIIAGNSMSGISGDKTEEFYGTGFGDCWVLKLDSLGNIEWQNTLAGDTTDYASAIIQTSDGGYLLGGTSYSDSSYDKSENAIGDGYYAGVNLYNRSDYWIIKLDANGIIEWENTIGGNESEVLTCVVQTIDGGYLIGGWSDSEASGDKSATSTSTDYWIVKLSSLGEIEWDKTIGGSSSDWLYSFVQTNDSGYILGGTSVSDISGDKTANNFGSDDYWIVKIDSIGYIQWDRGFGGNQVDRLFFSEGVKQTIDGGYILAGHSYSGSNGNKTENNFGLRDYWVVKINSIGAIEWQNAFGGNSDDILMSVHQTTDTGFVLGGYSKSDVSGNKTEPHWGGGGVINGYDYWIVKIDSLGSIQWQKVIGGTNYDEFGSVEPTPDNGYIIGGSSQSGLSGNKTEASMGGLDFWIVKLGPDCLLTQEICNGFDDNCNGIIDEGWPMFTYYIDADGDAYGNALIDTLGCSIIPGYVADSTDCNDTNPDIYPGTAEVCNGIDDNCNEMIDEGLTFYTYYLDADGDEYGNALIDTLGCTPIPGYVTDSTDCNDSNPDINPGIPEVCNGMDDNCDGNRDEGLPFDTYYVDADTDNYGDALIDSLWCASIPGFVLDSTDCDDTNPDVHPGATEILDGIDNNCNGLVDEGFNSIEVVNHKSISIYPNPADNYLTIETPANEMVQVIILNNVGDIMLTGLGNRLDVSNLPAGIYFVKVVGENFTSINKVIKK